MMGENVSARFQLEVGEEEHAEDRARIALFQPCGFADAENWLFLTGGQDDRGREAKRRGGGCRLLEKRQHMIAVGAVVAADQIEQAAFGLIEAVHGSCTFAKTEQAVRQVA